ncbi:uncharacterized protein LOC124896810 [Capsicum annuum]|uniref:uncharacterized protein LOC124896810 n=1 Tax=Capsicum annuum TaxID=4072 RepID=UPI001FB0B86F|nr:uncharacterized protein LOC124896810 [Capsicum annuum]
MAKAYTISEFKSLMKKVKQIDVRVKEYFQKDGYDKWTRVYATVNHDFTLTLNSAEIINKHPKKARELHIYDFLEKVVPTTNYVYAVLHEDRRYIVCLERKTCTCHRFQIDEILCAHAYAVLKSKYFEADDYCSNLYKLVAVLGTYEIPLLPLPDRST